MTKKSSLYTVNLDAGKVKPIAVGLKEGEVAGLEQIADALGITRNGLMRFIIRRFLVDYEAGRVKMEVEEKLTKSLKLP